MRRRRWRRGVFYRLKRGRDKRWTRGGILGGGVRSGRRGERDREDDDRLTGAGLQGEGGMLIVS